MTALTVLIHAVGDPPLDDGTKPENNGGDLRLHSFCILEKGTSSGDTSVVLNCVNDETGKHHLVQITGNMFRAAAGAFKGADDRFKSKSGKDADHEQS